MSTQGGVTQSLIAVYKAMGGGWQAARAEPSSMNRPAPQ